MNIADWGGPTFFVLGVIAFSLYLIAHNLEKIAREITKANQLTEFEIDRKTAQQGFDD